MNDLTDQLVKVYKWECNEVERKKDEEAETCMRKSD